MAFSGTELQRVYFRMRTTKWYESKSKLFRYPNGAAAQKPGTVLLKHKQFFICYQKMVKRWRENIQCSRKWKETETTNWTGSKSTETEGDGTKFNIQTIDSKIIAQHQRDILLYAQSFVQNSHESLSGYLVCSFFISRKIWNDINVIQIELEFRLSFRKLRIYVWKFLF
jgi:hypothetical protein